MRRSTRLRGHDATAAEPGSKRQKPDDSAAPTAAQPSDSKQRAAWDAFLQAKCFLNAPNDLFTVFELASKLRPEGPCEAFVGALGLRLCGPFDLLAKAGEEVTVDKPLHLHGRFFSDPPEVTAVMVDTQSDEGRHWGYFRDAPDQVPEYVVCAESSRECKFDIVGNSLLQVLEKRVEERRKTMGDKKAAELMQKIEAHRDEKAARRQSESALRAKRAKDCVAASLSQLGIVVPVNSKTNTGFRELPTTGKDLAELLSELEQDAGKKSAARKRLSELITRATIASDECDFGTGLLLGLDVFTAPCLEKEALQLLRVAYMLLRRASFYKIVSGHCKHRDSDNLTACLDSLVVSDGKNSDKQSKLSTVQLPPPVVGRK